LILIGVGGVECGAFNRSQSFTYQVHVLEETSLRPIQGAQVRIMIYDPGDGPRDWGGGQKWPGFHSG
jgi:hypothetical protein